METETKQVVCSLGQLAFLATLILSTTTKNLVTWLTITKNLVILYLLEILTFKNLTTKCVVSTSIATFPCKNN